MRPVISVIVPCYNLEDRIGETLASLITQSFTEWEAIVVDDGSRDASVKVIERMARKDSRITLVKKENGGVSSARNRGIREAKGRYVTFLDGDDRLFPGVLETCMKAMEEDTDLLIFGLTLTKGEEKLVIPGDVFSCDRKTYFREHYFSAVKKRLIFGPYNKLIKRELLEQYGIRFREDIDIREDCHFNLDLLAKAKKLQGIEEAGYIYVQSETGTSLVGKYHANEGQINTEFFKRLLLGFGKKKTEKTVVREIYPMFLNMELTSIYKGFCTDTTTVKDRLSLITSIIHDPFYKAMRRIYARECGLKAVKYYRGILGNYVISAMKARRKER